jgi:D-sedoheptulose 7-phosphate isomerase
MSYSKYIINYLSEVQEICELIDNTAIDALVQEIMNLKGRLFVLGVGGSAANASHAVNDFRKILRIDTHAVTDNSAELTARINDDGWETCYVNSLIVSKLGINDAILVFSVGGGSDTTSLNLVRSMEYASAIGAKIFSIVSRDGGRAKVLSDVCVIVPPIVNERITAHAEEWQMIILHLIVNAGKNED